MSLNPILEFWPEGIAAARTPANNNVRLLHAYVLTPATSATTTAQPTPVVADGDPPPVYIIPAGATGAQWATFAEGDVAIYYAETWTSFAAFEGLRKTVLDEGTDGENWQYLGGAWAPEPGGGGGVAAEDVSYDNTTSGLTATEVQAAIDELAAGGIVGNKIVNVALSDMTTDLTTGTAKAAWFAGENGTLVSVFIGVHDPSSSGIVRVDMNDAGGSVFTTRPAIDATEATSLTGTDAVLDGTVTFSRGDKFTFDIDDAGTDAKGLQVCIEYTP